MPVLSPPGCWYHYFDVFNLISLALNMLYMNIQGVSLINKEEGGDCQEDAIILEQKDYTRVGEDVQFC